ncbi:MAG: hypothetical protein K2Y09_03780 [Nitrosomonas sp.]|uniref:Nmad2 family putative nucleotide modification protein n=1 Tax=Nitrosomonas sp. TaxID=42353 RepID=UPI001DF5E889|nr:hypothetical protein [Nitrosomonas sp.]MBX9894285.1 hypothetical protein [Nitrosomonas sp.]
MKLYSYVVDHDHGLSPNPADGFCTLVHCKFNKSGKRKNIVEMAKIGDWVLGTGGQNLESAGNGKVVYLMRVDETLSFADFLKDSRFYGRADQCDRGESNTVALISKHFYYFGRDAIDIPLQFCNLQIEKKGPGYRSDLPPQQIERLIAWFQRNKKIGILGEPCSPIHCYMQSSQLVCPSACVKPRKAEAESIPPNEPDDGTG